MKNRSMNSFKLLTVALVLALCSSVGARPLSASQQVPSSTPLNTRDAKDVSSAGDMNILQSQNAPAKLVNAGLAGTISVPTNSTSQGNPAAAAQPGVSPTGPQAEGGTDMYGDPSASPSLSNGSSPPVPAVPDSSSPPSSASSPVQNKNPAATASATASPGQAPQGTPKDPAGLSDTIDDGTDPNSAAITGTPSHGDQKPSAASTPRSMPHYGPPEQMGNGSPAATATHDTHGNPWPSDDSNQAMDLSGSAGLASSFGPNNNDSNPFSGLESDFPTYSQFADNKTDAVVHPYLAETDTIFSTDSDREYGPAPYESRYRALDDSTGTFDILKRWGSLAPYFSNPMYPSLQQQKSLPNHCSIQQVHMLHRPGARMPLDSPDEAVKLFQAWHTNATTAAVAPDSNTTFEGPLTFLNSWQYGLGTNELTRAGYQQMYDSGVHSFYRYGGLFNETTENHKIVIRATTASRLFDSAEAWAVGFFGFKGASKAASIEVAIEQPAMNVTLAPEKACPAANTSRPGTDMADKWVSHYTEHTVKRLQHFVKGVDLTPEIVHAMQAMCPYETYALGMSDFCTLFTRNEWDSFEYSQDLRFQGNYGFMSPTGRAQGIGWAQELIARLKGKKLDGGFTLQNATLDGDPQAFPLDQRMYLDFAHDNLLVSVLAALNYTSFNTKLDPLRRDRTRNFIMSHISPFAARLFFEVIECDEGDNGAAKQKYIRTILNDALLPMSADQGCVGHQSQHDGLCPLDGFIKNFETKSVQAANFTEACFASPTSNSTNGTDLPPSDASGSGIAASPADASTLSGPNATSAAGTAGTAGSGGSGAMVAPGAASASDSDMAMDPTLAKPAAASTAMPTASGTPTAAGVQGPLNGPGAPGAHDAPNGPGASIAPDSSGISGAPETSVPSGPSDATGATNGNATSAAPNAITGGDDSAAHANSADMDQSMPTAGPLPSSSSAQAVLPGASGSAPPSSTTAPPSVAKTPGAASGGAQPPSM